jgi:hypothetical protein
MEVVWFGAVNNLQLVIKSFCDISFFYLFFAILFFQKIALVTAG